MCIQPGDWKLLEYVFPPIRRFLGAFMAVFGWTLFLSILGSLILPSAADARHRIHKKPSRVMKKMKSGHKREYRLGDPVVFHVKGIICYSEVYEGESEFRILRKNDPGPDTDLHLSLSHPATGAVELLVSWAEYVDADLSWDQKEFIQTGEEMIGDVKGPKYERRQVMPGEYAAYVYEPTELKLDLKPGGRISLGPSGCPRTRARLVHKFKILPAAH